jgi:hypothetical protein
LLRAPRGVNCFQALRVKFPCASRNFPCASRNYYGVEATPTFKSGSLRAH